MKILKTVAELRAYRREIAGSVGLVPTMGYLHEGHLSLVRQSKSDCEVTVVSIFVNPTQFGPNEDFKSYPRDLNRDLKMLETGGAAAVFLPSPEAMYPRGANTFVVPGKVAEPLEGAVRPGHFKGVATIVLKLFNLVQPEKAYFGQKDAQQVAVIKKMIADLDVPVEIVVMPTVRERDGLAMSSRNAYLNAAERQAATILYRSLSQAQEAIAAGERDADLIRRRLIELISAEPLARIDYVSVADAITLDELPFVIKPLLISLAVRIGQTRLIDNVVIGAA